MSAKTQKIDPAIAQFKPAKGQWDLITKNLKRTDHHTGETILHNYCKFMNTTPIDVFKYLVEKLGCNINLQDKEKDTPVHHALRYFESNPCNDRTNLMYLLEQKTIDVNIRGKLDRTLFLQACFGINNLPIEVFQCLLEKGAEINDRNANSPLSHTIRLFSPEDGGKIETLTYLLGHRDTDINTKSRSGRTLLHFACMSINSLPLDVFKLMVETKGANIAAKDMENDTPIHSAIRSFNPVDGGDLDVLTFLLDQNGVNVNAKGINGSSLLHLACEHINNLPIGVFKHLVEAKQSNLNLMNRFEDTPMHLAVQQFDPKRGGKTDVLIYLLNQKGVNVNIKGRLGSSLLHVACSCINDLPLDVFKCLIERIGCNPNLQDNNKNTPIHYALRHFKRSNGGEISVLTYLLNNSNIDITIQGRHGRTLLHLASLFDLSGSGDGAINRFDNPFLAPSSSPGESKPTAEGDLFWSKIIEIMSERILKQIKAEDVVPVDAAPSS
jgi:ankyrin repeat protein